MRGEKKDFIKYFILLYIIYNFYTRFYEINHITVAADEDIPILLLSILYNYL